MQQPVLGSWKEIANYLGKGVRTVQRWERYSGLPIHRPSGSSKGVVIAFPHELDQWARRQDGVAHAATHLTLHRNTILSAQLADRTRQLRDSTEALLKRTVSFMEMAKRRRAETDSQSDRFLLPKPE